MADYSQQAVSDCGEILRDMLSRFGPNLSKDEKRFKGMALDFIPDLPVVNLLLLALNAGVPQELQAPVGNTPKSIVIGRIIARLQQSHNLNESGARLAVLAWAHALGILDQGEVAAFFQPNVFSSSPNEALSKEYSVTTIQVQGVKFDFCWIPPGKFIMGEDDPKFMRGGGPKSWMNPAHEVEITKGFWLGRTPVTQGQWQVLMGNNPAKFKKGDAYPVEQVTWNDCQRFIKRIEIFASKKYRLPTEAEWEYACRAGTTGERYGPLDEIAWYSANTSGSTEAVAQLKPNAWGLRDMLGNIYEWCQDWFSDKYYATSPIQNPSGPAQNSSLDVQLGEGENAKTVELNNVGRVVRGGDFKSDADGVTAASRFFDDPDSPMGLDGFRLIMEP